MPRVSKGAARRQSKKRVLKQAKGFRGSRQNYRLAKEAIVHAAVYATRDRRCKKRDFRQLWVTRISAALTMRGVRYSQFIFGLKKASVTVNRKMLADMAHHDVAGFDAIVAVAQKALSA